ncbi:MAG: outer membrane lipoprotein carrier protein LolA [Proteobacteria bacterium]|nr:outer membrane lipoprotein carrier protein LolA [Pseudomonadota bacterium]MBU1419210.1 outer membrane lipoprotein carrier protein LolA [Pseudomonadota bacterium]MBU1454912.1 outer membrane lipoprotein carrier protein LolA [Pseudomonadota bacterium]
MKTIQTRHRNYILLFLIILLSTLPFTALAKESPEDTASRLQKRYDEINSLTFDFIQDTRGQLSGRPKKGRGQAFFVKSVRDDTSAELPGMMRWDYSDPDQQVLVSDGETFSMYFAALQQMIVTSAESLKQDLTYSFFTGSGNLLQDFKILESTENSNGVQEAQDQTIVIKLIPKAKQSQVASIHLWITEDSLIRRIEILDHFDTLTVLNFSNIKVNTLSPDDAPLMKHLFTFTPPEGTEIIHQ